MERSFAGFPRSYPGRDGGRRRGRAGLLARRVSSGTTLIAHGKTLRDYGEFAITGRAGRIPGAERSPDCSWITTASSQTNRRDRDLQPPGHRITPPVPGHEHRRLGHGHPGCLPRRAVHRVSLKQFEQNGEFPEPRASSACPTTTPAAPRPAARRPPRRWPTTTSPSARSSRPSATAGSGRRPCIFAHRGRSAERLGPRERLSHHRLRRQPLHPAPVGRSARSTTRPASCARWS